MGVVLKCQIILQICPCICLKLWIAYLAAGDDGTAWAASGDDVTASAAPDWVEGTPRGSECHCWQIQAQI